ncbi:MAG: prolipoprotein diacylglyceryl transferase [Deltaproteobacteria bacterium]|jgi:phosphatidylglycerol:prolipoprotein diacylglycerol transferase
MENLIYTWQHIPESISPNLFEVGTFQIRYYSLMYIVAFMLTYILVAYRIKRDGYDYPLEIIQDYFIWAIIGLILGARLGYVLFYNFDYYLIHPLEILLPFDFSRGIRFVGISGMSYHGGAIGVLMASIIFCWKRKIDFWNFADLFCPAIPLGYTFGRIGNFINGELYGRMTDVPWGMYFPHDPTRQLRHPSQLYEAFFEGIVLFIILWSLRKKKTFDGFFFSLYLIGYGMIRFVIEFLREPDLHLGFIWASLSMGQLLCLLMMGAGMGVFAYRRSAAYVRHPAK